MKLSKALTALTVIAIMLSGPVEARNGSSRNHGGGDSGTPVVTPPVVKPPVVVPPSVPPTGATDIKISNVYITWYGFNDNSCETEAQHSCSNIAFPKSDGYPTPHNAATEGVGSYDDPITFATAADNNGKNAEFAPGEIIYVPKFRKYFVMEDSCAECSADWKKTSKVTGGKIYHVDLWMGPQSVQNAKTLEACENSLTQGSAANGTGVIISKPTRNWPVDAGLIYANGKCTTHIYPN